MSGSRVGPGKMAALPGTQTLNSCHWLFCTEMGHVFHENHQQKCICWILWLQKFDFVIEYRKGKLSVALDMLSRSSPTSSCRLQSPELRSRTAIVRCCPVGWTAQRPWSYKTVASSCRELCKSDGPVWGCWGQVISENSPAKWPVPL